MSESFLRRGAVGAVALLLAVAWLAVAVRPGAAQRQGDDKTPPVASEAAKSKPAASDADQDDPFGLSPGPEGAAVPRKKPALKHAVPAAQPGNRRGTIETRGAAIEPGAAEAAIERALNQKIDKFEFDQVPLNNVVAQLSKHFGINILLDGKALDDASIDPSMTKVTMSLRGVSLRSALDLLFRGLGLTWTINRELLVITTPEVADDHLITRVYDVANLVRCRDEKGVLWDDYDSLIDAIERCVDMHPPFCTNGSSSGAMLAGQTFGNAHVLIVYDMREIHERIAKLLDDLRKVAAKAGPDQPPPVRNKPKPQRPRRGGGDGGVPMSPSPTPYVG